ncbi:hypothetical protein AU106_gp271 [Sinorhizobium phage phiM9]|uniref:Uncharacterized protein n=1 Tax=Sinorhizobium phage phiM9 TaxID=1636182 RepID=A0A0F6R571_9CAUD|nr:hypothetical protein AU106_gp271 [Sinorhizobium phage phiM9]AKE44902.1 hypothetical protein Sm_phiM9_275 [Sinorhizobium phage phiM9]
MYFELVDQMHTKFGFYDAVKGFDQDKFLDFLEFRAEKQIGEEVGEFVDAVQLFREAREAGDVEKQLHAIQEINDAIVDILVFAFGTATFTMSKEELEQSYWTVMKANIDKEVGIKPGRPNPLGLPDLIKPEGWKSPDIRQHSRTLKNVLDSKAPVIEGEVEELEKEAE